ncbi:MAG: hypothetical protein AB1567_00765 [bacterium]
MKEVNEKITRRQFFNKQFLTPLSLISILFDDKIEDDSKEDIFDLDKLPVKDKKLFQQLAG